MKLTEEQKEWIRIEFSSKAVPLTEKHLSQANEPISLMEAISRAEAELAGIHQSVQAASQIVEVDDCRQ